MSSQRNYTTGDVARICQVAARTICKWCDQGLIRHFRQAGTNNRLIPQPELVRFLKEHGLAIPAEMEEQPEGE